ncbi:VOC family protein [Neobacillus sp. PS3-34]|uniref:VOC family protein n=1 Tax=Neobacillus sp. PS3-34 TaxID=3070678 RepID=UPI0027DF4B86|nr:VOC family protein [Neobacillus sp. PS3-34]WML46653.1 VOC family protein [Neobacillus sp. PS3-34]
MMLSLFTRIDTVFLKVQDFESAIAWYSQVLGFTVRWRDDNSGYAALNVGETPLTLVRKSNEDETAVNSIVPFNFFVSDIEGAYEHLLQNGVKVGPIQGDGNVKWFKFQDLEGNPLEVCHFKE